MPINPVTEEPRLRPLYKIGLFIAIWIGALIATNPDGGLWALTYMFPLGLAGFFNRRWGNDGGWWVLGVCVGIYVVHAFLYFRSRTARSTVLWFALLTLLLLCNIAGCREMIHGH